MHFRLCFFFTIVDLTPAFQPAVAVTVEWRRIWRNHEGELRHCGLKYDQLLLQKHISQWRGDRRRREEFGWRLWGVNGHNIPYRDAAVCETTCIANASCAFGRYFFIKTRDGGFFLSFYFFSTFLSVFDLLATDMDDDNQGSVHILVSSQPLTNNLCRNNNNNNIRNIIINANNSDDKINKISDDFSWIWWIWAKQSGWQRASLYWRLCLSVQTFKFCLL